MSSSGEEDGDADWKAAIDSVSAVSQSKLDGVSSSFNCRKTCEDEEQGNRKSHSIKHYQIKAQKLLDEILEKTVEVVTNNTLTLDNKPTPLDGGVRLFKHAPSGIVFDHAEEHQRPKKKPKILPGEEIIENSKKFKKQLQSAAVNGVDVIAASKFSCQKSLAKLEAREEAAKVAARREEERVARLKKTRGERWLPSVATYMRANLQNGR